MFYIFINVSLIVILFIIVQGSSIPDDMGPTIHVNATTTVLATNSTTGTPATTTTTTTATTTTTTAPTVVTTQQGVNVSGRVTDMHGTPVPFACVHIKQGADMYEAVCDGSGNYSFQNQTIGTGYFWVYASAGTGDCSEARSSSSNTMITDGLNVIDLQIPNWLYVPITTTTEPTPTPEPTPMYNQYGYPVASVYVNVCSQYNYRLTGISWGKSGTNGAWIPLLATGMQLSGNLSMPTRVNIPQNPAHGWPDLITVHLAGTYLSCTFELQVHARLEINMCDCEISQDPVYGY